MDHAQAQAELDAAKALCQAACGDTDAAVALIDPDARAAAIVAHHVLTQLDDPLGAALGAGRMVGHEHLAAVAAVVKAVGEGKDPVEAAGADPSHVDALAAAAAKHEPHRERLAAAYAEFARSGGA